MGTRGQVTGVPKNLFFVSNELHLCYHKSMDSLFGSGLRTDVLVAIARLGETYAAELARLWDRRPLEIQRAVASLERAGVVTTRLLGRTRIVELNPRLPEYDELYQLLLRMSERPRFSARWSRERRRPRAMGKPL